jgi:hypothetical protein
MRSVVLRTKPSLTVVNDGWIVARFAVSADVRAVKSRHRKERKERSGKEV